MAGLLKPNQELSRRSFLKLSNYGFAALTLSSIQASRFSTSLRSEENYNLALKNMKANGLLSTSGHQEWTPHHYGRVIDPYIEVYSEPSFEAQRLEILWKDAIVPLVGIFYNEETESHNKVWYKISADGFVHSGVIQPVNTELNNESSDIPLGGRLAEVTVPFTDSIWSLEKPNSTAYRFYYQTTHWVVDLHYTEDGEPWYMLIEDKWELRYFVRARHLRLMPYDELSPISLDVPSQLKHIEIHLPQQYLIALEDSIPVFMARVATGGKFIDGDFTTQTGHYITFHKRPSRHMAAGNLAAGGYDLPGVPWISYFTESGISLHGTYWHNNFGKPRSHGCVNLTTQAAKWIYRWTLPIVPYNEQRIYEKYGTSVFIYDT